MYITEEYRLPAAIVESYRSTPPNFGFGLLGAATYYRTYSRLMPFGAQESWLDTCVRVVEGCIAIRKHHALSHRLPWDTAAWDRIAIRMLDAMFHMRFLPPGRGLYAGGTDYVRGRGAMALQNCGYTEVSLLSRDAAWAMDALMCGVGIGFDTMHYMGELRHPANDPMTYVIPDSREGWVESLRLLIKSYEDGSDRVVFDYSQIRPYGAPIKGFGGTASGYQPLEQLHNRVRSYLDARVNGLTSNVRTITDVMNAIGACVVAGNVRRSAEIALGSPHNLEFLNLKNYGTDEAPGPSYDRMDIGWMSNNTVVLRETDDFKKLPDIAELVRINGEPGLMNLLNIQKYGRYGEEKIDLATGCNPCAEQPLENKEVCCLVEVFPTRCLTDLEYYDALELAQIYAHTISLLPTHSPETNAVVARNHRIGQSLSGIADWYEREGAAKLVTMQREGYRLVREVNRRLSEAAGVPESVRVTTVKPSGTISLLAGVSPGMHYPMYSRYIRRMRVGKSASIVDLLKAAGVPYEDDVVDPMNTYCFEFPVDTGVTKGQRDISIWQKAAMVVSLQKHWSDNMVSNTLTFDPQTEGGQIEDVLAYTLPFVKTLSLLPDAGKGAYQQMPYEAITKDEYTRRSKAITDIDWSEFGDSNGMDEQFCTSCEVDLATLMQKAAGD